MPHRSFLILLAGFLLSTAWPTAYALDVGQLALIEDKDGKMLPAEGSCSNILMASGMCLDAVGKEFYRTHGDNYELLMVFTSKVMSPIFNVQMGFPVQQEIEGIGLKGPAAYKPAMFGSAGRLLQFVKMGDLSKLPDQPSARVNLPPITGIELMAHETGHHWMAWILLDKGGGPLDILRGYESDKPNGHWSGDYNSGSVMYGGFITDNGNGTFTSDGGVRKYSQLDQYLMGLRGAEEVEPMFYVVKPGDDGLHGNPTMPSKPGYPTTFSATRVDFTIDDVIRANGQRNPTRSICHLKAAFGLVYPAGQYPTQAQIDKVERYRQALEAWWPEGTDQRGSLDTRLDGCGIGTTSCVGKPSLQCGAVPGCTEGDKICKSAALAQLCEGGAWRDVPCASGTTCLQGSCQTVAADGDTQDTDADLVPDGDTSEPPADGDTEAEREPELEREKDGTHEDGDISEAREDGELTTNCEPGAYRCSHQVLERCSANGSAWLPKEDCYAAGKECSATGASCIGQAGESGSNGGCQSARLLSAWFVGFVLLCGVLRRRGQKRRG